MEPDALGWGADKLAYRFSRKVPGRTEFEEAAASTAMQRVHAAAALALRSQARALENTLRGIMIMEHICHICYDETPLHARAGFSNKQKDR